MARIMVAGQSVTIYDRSLTALKKKMSDTRYELEHGTYISASKITFGEFFSEWIQAKQGTVKHSTLHTYETRKVYLGSIWDIKLSDIRASHITKVLNEMQEKGYSQSLIGNVYHTLRNVFSYAVKMDMISKNPCDQVMTIPKSTKETRKGVALTREQEDIFIQYCNGLYVGDIFQFDLQTGMRCGELCALKWSDVDFKNKLIHVNATVIYDGTLGTPKSKTSKRAIPMTDTAREILKRRYEETYGDVIQMNNDDFVFPRENGKAYSLRSLDYAFNKIKESIIEDGNDFPEQATVHSLRHTYATRCSEAQMDLNTLKVIMGHSSLSMTADLYSHVTDTRMISEIEKIQQAL